MVPMNGRGFRSAGVDGSGPRSCLGSGDGNVAGALGAAVAGDWAVGSGGCVGRPPACENDKETNPTHTPKMTTAVLEPLMTFSIALYKRASPATPATLRKFHWPAAAQRRNGSGPCRQN